MKELTVENFAEYWPQIRDRFNEGFQEQGELVLESLEFRGEDAEVDEHIDLAIRSLNKMLAKILSKDAAEESDTETDELTAEPAEEPTHEPTEELTDEPADEPTEEPTEEPAEEPTVKPKAKTRKAKSTKPKQPKQPKEKPAKQPKYDSLVNKPSLQVRLAARFVKLHGKNFTQEVKDEAKKILFALQKAIINREIRKEGYGALSAYAAEMRKMQDKLVKMCNAKTDASAPVEIVGIEDFRKIARSEGSRASADAMRNYARLATKSNPTKKEAEATLNKVDKVMARNEAGDYSDLLSDIRDALSAFISGDVSSPLIMEQTLEGVRNLCGDVKKKRRNQ